MDKSVGYFARESGLIIFSILAALGVNEWRMRATADAERQEAFAAVYAELNDNLAILESLPAYHAEVAAALRSKIDAVEVLADAAKPTPMDAFISIDSLRPAIITDRVPQDVSWELAKQRGAAARFDYETARNLSVIYDAQRNSVIPLIGDIAALLSRPEMYVPRDHAAALMPIAAQFAELSSREEALVANLRKQIDAMQTAHPELASTSKD